MKKNWIFFRYDPGRLKKMWLMLKLTSICLLLSVFQLHARSQAVSLNLKNATLQQVIWAIESQTNFIFMYSKDDLDKSGKVSVNLSNEHVEKILEKCLQGTGLTYVIQDEVIVLRPQTRMTLPGKLTLTGLVVDRQGNSLPGVTILLKGTSMGSVTDARGNFKFEIPEMEEMVLVFSFVGMKKKEVIYRGEEVLKIVLEEETAEMEEVVVTGIFERKKESFTGSATTYSSRELKKVGNQNIIQSLKSLDPAFAILENNEAGSDPNHLPDLEIRGKSSIVGLKEQYNVDPNQPLFILDGFETSLQTIMDLDMDRVASITILKDAASTAIYGSKAANGVVVVETVKPEQGKLRVTYSGNFNIQMPDLSSYKLMNSEEKLRFEVLSGYYKSTGASNYMQLQELYNKRLADVRTGVNTYWLGEPVRIGLNHRHSLYAEGGDENMRYGIGVSYNGISGVMKESQRDIFSGNLDLIYRKNRFLFSNKLTVNYNSTHDPIVEYSEYAAANPYYKKRTEDGEIEKWLEYSDYAKVQNPLWNASLNSRKRGRMFGVTNNFSAEYNPVTFLKLRARLGVTKSITETDHFTSPEDSRFDEKSSLEKGSLTYMNNKGLNYEAEFTASLGYLFREIHRINLVAGGNLSSSESVGNGYAAIGFPKGEFDTPVFSKGYPENGKPSFSESTSRSVSAYVNGGYSLKDGYLLDLTWRLSGSSVFGTNKRYTHTWSVGLAWNVHNENFIRKYARWITLLKIRGSVGNPGNQNFSSYQTISTYVFQTYRSNYFEQGVLLNSLGNPDLEWQKTLDKNIGADLTFMNNRMSVNVDYFNKVTDPLLVNVNVPSSLGMSTVMTNLGKQTSRGWNGTLIVSPVYKPEERIVWSVRYNFRTQKTKYGNMGNGLDKFNEANRNVNLTRYYDGADPDALYAVRSHGIDPVTGKEIFIRKDGTYTFDYDSREEVKVGIGRPKVEGIIGTSFSYKGFSVNLDFRYRWGGKAFNQALYNKVENISVAGLSKNQDKRALYDRWQEVGDIAFFKGISLTETTPMSSRFVEKDNSIALESFRVGYEFDSASVRKIGLRSLRLNAYMNDIFRVSSIKTERGTSYPFARSVSFSLSAAF